MTNDGQRSDPAGFQIENEMDLLYGRAHPNPSREGCPPRDVLVSFSRRERPIGDPAYDHLFKCSPCYQEFRALQQANVAQRAAAKRKRIAYAAAAVLVLVVGGSWFALRRPENTAGPSLITQVTRNARLDLRPFSVTRGGDRAKEAPPLILSRARLNATILLPVGSEPGTYDVQLLDANLQSRATSTGTATIVDFVTTLATTLNTSALPAGSYQLAVRRQGEDWRMFPAQLR